MSKADCDFLYFKRSGKWAYEGEGNFPDDFDVNRKTIMKANEGGMPGISSDASDMTVIVIPRENCTCRFAYPRLLKPEVSA